MKTHKAGYSQIGVRDDADLQNEEEGEATVSVTVADDDGEVYKLFFSSFFDLIFHF